MYRLLPVLGLALLLGLGGCQSESENTPETAPRTSSEAKAGTSYETNPRPAPDLELTTMDGQTMNLANQNGKVVLVNFWATWCAPCRREIPDLIDLYANLKSDGLVIIGIAVDQEGAEVVEPFVKEQEVNYPIVLDPDQSTESHFDAMYGLPTTYVVNPDGQIVQRILGVFPIEKMRPRLEEMLSDAAASS